MLSRRRTGAGEADAHAWGSPTGGGRPGIVGAHRSRRASHRCGYQREHPRPGPRRSPRRRASRVAGDVRVPAAQPDGGDQQRTQSRADWRRPARSGRGPAGSCPRSSCAQMRRLFLVPAGTARL